MNTNSFFRIPARWALPVAIINFLQFATAQTVTYTNAGMYTNIVPAGAAAVQIKIWGAGGGNGSGSAVGGAGAFAGSTFQVSSGQTLVTVVGQRGSTGNTSLGGAGSGDAPGGAPGYLGDYNGRGQGGQGSTVFELTNGFFFLKTLAGAGGGGGGFGNSGVGGGGGQAGGADSGSTTGQPGANGIGGAGGGPAMSGSNYAINATTIGITNLNLAFGNGGSASNWSGGGGGGFGGGGGGGGGTGGNGAGGGGGGSYGDAIVPGNGTQPGNASDPSYVAGTATPAHDGLAVITISSAGTLGATNIQLTQATLRGLFNPSGLDSLYHFDYGTSTNYGSSTPTVSLPGSPTTVTVSQSVSNLSPGTLYHCRLIVSNANGTVSGGDALFTTPAARFVYSTAGIYTTVLPAGSAVVQVRIWGAGGGNGTGSAAGGAGAFAASTFQVSPGQTFVTVIGQRGSTGNANLGGAGSGDAPGGAPGYLGDYNGRAQGGQASSVFQLTNGFYFLKALAGAGGGAGGFNNNGFGGGGGQAGGADSGSTTGQPGANGIGGTGGGTAQPGSNYASNAATIGITNLNLAFGNGGSASNWSGGGGGGFGGGGGGGGGTGGNGAGGAGGGSYGDAIVPANGAQPGNSSDPSYVAGTATPAHDGLAVITISTAGTLGPTNIQLTQATLRGLFNPFGLDSLYHFDYGISTNYGSSTPAVSLPGSPTTVLISQILSNLFPGTLYHCRLVVSNANGAVSGGDVLFSTPVATFVYSTAGVYLNVAPPGVKKVIFKLWGAGGAGMYNFPSEANGGGGAYSSVTLNAQPGDTYIVVVGQRGAYATNSLGGAGSGDTEGGAPGFLGDYNNRGQGGQASSVFFMTNNLLITKAVAGAGGGAGLNSTGSAGPSNGGGGGQAGVNGGDATAGQAGENGTGGAGGGTGASGGGYNTNAITSGISALNQVGGNGGNATNWSGGGGGGYGGGGGGGGGTGGNGAGGGGGGSYGTVVTNGNGYLPGNTSDVNYVGSAGQGGVGGAGGSTGSDGLAVVLWIPSNPPAPLLSNPARLGNGSFQSSFGNVSGTMFSVSATTNLANSNGWSVLGPAAEISLGQFRFTDPQATNNPLRFYRVQSQ